MVKRTSDLIGRPVVASDTGKKLGTIADFLVDDDEKRVVGLVVRHGWMNDEEVLPAASVPALGSDTVVSRSSELVGAKQWRDRMDTVRLERDDRDDPEMSSR